MKKNLLQDKRVHEGIAYIKSTFSNTIITISDKQGNCLTWATGGSSGFKGPRRGSAYAAQASAEIVSKKIKDAGINSLVVEVQGFGDGREAAIRGLASHGIRISSVRDNTAVSHGGCKLPKKRRL
jgi:small subunit ribosomal protein S11